MCSPMRCRSCGKASWSGCGAHVEMILGHLPKEKRCQCRASAQSGNDRASMIAELLRRYG
jgi:hypothetical protein